MKLVAKIATGLVVAVGMLAGVVLFGMRRKSPVVLDAVRRMNKEFMNPQQMESAGTPGAYAGIIKHVGRRSGKQYETPVGIEETVDGFVITLPYGRRADWLQNVLAAGSAAIVHEGQTYEVTDPQVIPLDGAPGLSADDLRIARLFGVNECLKVRRAG